MIDINTKIKNRIYKTHDLNTLWQKLRNEGCDVWEDEDYIDNEQAPWHLYYIDKGYGARVEVLYRERTEQELQEDRDLDITPFKQEIEWVKY